MTPAPPTRVAVVIATSGRRAAMLLGRAVPSVYQQVDVDPSLVSVVIVDDNLDATELARIEEGVVTVRAALGLAPAAFATTVCRNQRARGFSGTGAWNTGIALMDAHSAPPEWIAILDDDDEFMPEHLARCMAAVSDGVAAVFERLEWIRAHGVEQRPFDLGDLTPEAFFVGNPGVQGSNLFVRRKALVSIGGFDETLPNTTDRDLMIRLLRHVHAMDCMVVALPSVGVRYFDHDGPRVNTDRVRKHAGLDRFYDKHARDFSPALLALSLQRAARLFGYEGRR